MVVWTLFSVFFCVYRNVSTKYTENTKGYYYFLRILQSFYSKIEKNTEKIEVNYILLRIRKNLGSKFASFQ